MDLSMNISTMLLTFRVALKVRLPDFLDRTVHILRHYNLMSITYHNLYVMCITFCLI